MNDEININEQLDILEETKFQIKQAIIDKGQSVSSSDSFRSYATKIGNIEVLNAQSKLVTPTTQQQIIEPDAPTYNGLSQVTVAGVTSAIDSNIQASNIKSGVSILGINGSVVELNGDTEIVTPTTSQQIITPTSPKNGLTQVTVNAVTSAIDNNIQASNIKNGVTILGIQGTYSDAMKSYVSTTAMNNDIANIQDGEVVKVDSGTTVEYYIKEAEIPDTYQPVDLSQYQVGDTISVKNMKIAETWSFTSELASGLTARLTLQYNNQTVLELQFTGSVHNVNGGITIGGTYYACSVANQLDVTVPSADLTTINSDVIWSSDNQLTITSVDNLLGNALLELVQGAPAKMVKLVKETEVPVSPQEYQQDVGLADDILGNPIVDGND